MQYYYNRINFRQLFVDFVVVALLVLGILWMSKAEAALVCVNEYGTSFTWYVGQPKESINFGDDIEKFSCAADGNELDYLRDRFDGFPLKVKGGHAVIWRGNIAQFVADNY